MTTPAHDENWFSENLNPNESGAFASLFKAYAEHYGKQLLADNADKSRRITELEAALGPIYRDSCEQTILRNGNFGGTESGYQAAIAQIKPHPLLMASANPNDS